MCTFKSWQVCFQATLTNNTRRRPWHEVDQAVSMVSALFQVERDSH